MELKPIGFRALSSLAMAGVLTIYQHIFKIEAFVSLYTVIGLGAPVYFVILLKIDGAIQTDLRNIIENN